ncbi:hypothetical protein D3D01_15755 [Haloarcula sp. Atlit-7R]|nr:hypothetical protein D3D01_15755 [Haloarcula sp. Atlit-7R]
MEICVRQPDGWETISFPSGTDIEVAGGKTNGQLALTLIGKRDDRPHIIEPGILDVKVSDEQFLETEVPRTPDGTSSVLAELVSK